MGKVISLFNEKSNEENHISLTREQEEEKIAQAYQECYSEPDEPDEYDVKVGDCCKCGLPIMEYEPLWQVNRMSGYGSSIEDDSMVICEGCLLKLINK